MKTTILVIGLIVLAPFSAWGDEKAELAKEIMELTNAERMMEQVKNQVMQMQDHVIAQMDIPEDRKEAALQFQKKIYAKIFETLNFEKMQNEYLDLYTDVYTLDELRGIVGFYKSPVGKSMLAKQPMVLKKSMEMTQNKMNELIPELKKMYEEFEQALHGK
jgi:hypothetical protein